jgi:hypothetical protein
MIPRVEIPERVHIVAHDAYDAAMSTASIFDCGCCEAVKAAAPIILADYLRKLAHRTNDLSTQIWLCKEADELDPPAWHNRGQAPGA